MDWLSYYFYAAGDFSPLGRLTVGDVIAIGKELNLPIELVEKTPADGLCGKSDEDHLGFTYAALDHYIRTGEYPDVRVKASLTTSTRKTSSS